MRAIIFTLARPAGMVKSLAAVCAGAASLCAAPAHGACSVEATPIAFGVYNGVIKAEVQTIATVTVRCTDLIVLTNYTVSLSPGQSGTATDRYLSNGANRLGYQVFADAARTQIFGDGAPGTVLRAGSVAAIIGIGSSSSAIQIFPSIRGGQSPSPGVYTDTLTITVSY